jgi:hypothetical protein
MGLFSRKTSRAELPPEVVNALELGKGERVLAFAVDDFSGDHVVATTYALAVVTQAAERTVRRRWLSVDAGVWEPETATLMVTWADGRLAG